MGICSNGGTWRTIGHEKAVNALRRSMREGRLSHAYLLSGPPNVGKMTLALDLARAVNCREEEKPCGECDQCRRIADGLHADIRVVAVETGEHDGDRSRVLIGIDQVREVQREASLKPYEGRYRVFIFDGAELLSEDAANSLLKILEEPPEQVILVLLATDVGGLLPTVVSRCTQLALRPLPLSLVAREIEARSDADPEKAEEIARLSGGRLGWALQVAREPSLLERRAERLAVIEATLRGGLEARFSYAADLASLFGRDRGSGRQEIELWLRWWRDVLVIREGVREVVGNLSRMETLQTAAEKLSSAQITGAIRAIQQISEYLERNVNPRLALEELMLILPRP